MSAGRTAAPDTRPLTWVDTEAALGRLMERLAHLERVAVDTESNAFHAYHEKVCLIQLSDAEADFLVDPLAIDVAPLGALFADPKRETVFHAAEYDVLMLKKDFGFRFTAIFDTQAAAMVLGEGQLGLAKLVERVCGVRLPKEAQRSDWARRPLTREQLEYARNDTAYLLEVHAVLAQRLEETGRYPEAQAVFERLTRVEPKARAIDPDAFYGLKGYRDLDPAGRAIAQRLFALREKRAARIDRPVFRVLGNEAVLTLAREKPHDPKALGALKGVPRRLPASFSRQIVDAIREGERDPNPPPVERPKRRRGGRPFDAGAEARFEALRRWRNARAEALGMKNSVIASNRVLKAIARAHPRTLEALAAVAEVDHHLVHSYGAEILAALDDSAETT
ncbi:MAG: ribonuclease D [Deltaproteobacteria bacterium]|nr:MAG: ribonuclease D [Deltaproteobacteria bacterium]